MLNGITQFAMDTMKLAGGVVAAPAKAVGGAVNMTLEGATYMTGAMNEFVGDVFEGPQAQQENTGVVAAQSENGEMGSESCGSLANNDNTPNINTSTESCGSLASVDTNLGKASVGPIAAMAAGPEAEVASAAPKFDAPRAAFGNLTNSIDRDAATKMAQTNQLASGQDFFGAPAQKPMAPMHALNNSFGAEEVNSSDTTEQVASIATTYQAQTQGTASEEAASAQQGSETLASADNMQAGNFAQANNAIAAAQNPISGTEAQNGSWAGAFVKEHSGWSAAYASEATSVSENAENAANTNYGNAQIATASFGSLTGAVNMPATDGMTVPMGAVESMMSAAMAASAAISNTTAGSTASASTASSASAGSSSSSSSSSAA